MSLKEKSKDYKISMVLLVVCLVLYGISFVTGLMPGLVYSVDKICMFLGFACMSLGFLFYYKDKRNNDNEER